MIRSGKMGGKLRLIKNGDLAELIGMVLGDGSIHKYERTEGLAIILPTSNPGQIDRYAKLIETVFGKKPSVIKRKTSNCVAVKIYQKNISSRLGVPIGKRRNAVIVVPRWIARRREFVIRYLRGLYEAEGCFSIHLPTSTYKLQFANRNMSMLDNVFNLMLDLGFHVHRSKYQIQLSRMAEVYVAVELLSFRIYEDIAGSYNGSMIASEAIHLGSNPSPAANKS